MAVYSTNDILQKWRYVTKEINLIIPGENTIKLTPNKLVSMSIIDNYEVNAFPIFRIELVLDYTTYYKILEAKKNIKFHLRVQKYYQHSDSITKSLEREYMNEMFGLILDDDDEDKNNYAVTLKNDYTKIKGNSSNDLAMTDNKVEFFLYKVDVINGLKENVNTILENATVSDAIAYIMTVANIKNLLMSVPTNTKTYDTLILPPLPALQQLVFIDYYYGIYNTGSVMYFGIDTSYILSYSGKCTAYKNKEIQTTNIVIPMKSSPHTTECGELKKQNNTEAKYIVGDYTTIGINNESLSNNILLSNDVEYINNYSGEVTSISSQTNSSDKNFKKIKLNKTVNPWLGEMYTTQTSSTDVVIDVKLNDFNISDIAPNKKFNFIFEDSSLIKKYNGSYMISSIEHQFIMDGDDFGLSSTVRFRKTK